MTTTAHEDQFTDAPEPARQPYETGSILRRNVADLEIALKQQTERAEAAEAELLAVREDNHSMMLEIDELRKELARLREQKPVRWHVRGNYFHDGDAAILFASMNSMCGAKVDQLYAAPVPAPAVPAPAVPEEWRNIVTEMLGWWDDPAMTMSQGNVIAEKARALLQSDEVRHD